MQELTLDLVARFPLPGMALPGQLSFSPDGKTLAFLHSRDGSLARELWGLDVATGGRRILFAPPDPGATEENVSREEALRRERQRLLATGVTHYAWAEEGDTLLVPLRGELWVVTGGKQTSVAQGTIDPHLSRDGTKVAFVRDGDLQVVDIASGEEKRLTRDAQPGVTNGLAEYAAQEEMGRSTGFWWSRDGKWIAYEQADERHIPLFQIPHWGTDVLSVEEHRYPFAGGANAKVRLGVISTDGGPTTWMDLDDAEYLARVAWHPDGRLFVQLQTRDQRRLELRAYDPRTGKGTTLLVETSTYWVNLHHDLRFVPTTGEFLWASERTGFKQLYLYEGDGTLVRAVTRGDWPVDAVCGFDPVGRRVAFTAGRQPVEKQVFQAGLEAGEPVPLTPDPGFHDAVFSRDLKTWVDRHESLDRAPSLTLRGPQREIHPATLPTIDLVRPELFSFRNRAGTLLQGMLYKPAKMPAPLVVAVYGGPGVQMVQDSWTNRVDLRAQYLAKLGFAVMKVDNRGSSRRGLEFEGAIAERMGTVEVDDQVDGVRHAQAKGWVDGDRVGVYGWSYGGYLTLMCLLKAAEVFKVGVAGAPATHWDGYDTHYTERYMRRPQDNPAGYREGSVIEHVGKLRGKLLLVHGMVDENVHFRHTTRLIQALSKAGRPYDLLAFPEERHFPRAEKDRRDMEERIVEYFRLHL
jgi:dipeptidyl-peptidase 4